MSMVLGDLLDMVRQDYVDALQHAAKALAEDCDDVVAEPLLLDDAGEVATAGALNLPARLDLVGMRPNRPQRIRVQSEGVFQFDDAIRFDFDGLEVQLSPFRWDAVDLTLDGLEKTPDWAPLVAWFEFYVAQDDDWAGEGLGVAHSITDPVRGVDGRWRLLADLGTAPVTAFEDLLDACAACGATAVMVGEKG